MPCSLCNSDGTNSKTCPLNNKAQFPDYSKHNLPIMSGGGIDIDSLYLLPQTAREEIIKNLDFYSSMIVCDEILSRPSYAISKDICTDDFLIQKRKDNDLSIGQDIYRIIKEAIDNKDWTLLLKALKVRNIKNSKPYLYALKYLKNTFGNSAELYKLGYMQNDKRLFELASILNASIMPRKSVV